MARIIDNQKIKTFSETARLYFNARNRLFVVQQVAESLQIQVASILISTDLMQFDEGSKLDATSLQTWIKPVKSTIDLMHNDVILWSRRLK